MRWGCVALLMCACGGTASSVPDSGLTDGGLTDGGVGDGGTADDCTGVVPVVPASATAFEVGATAGQTCSVSTTDGNGAIAAESHAGTPAASTQVSWHEFDVRGITAGSFTGGFGLVPQAAGFLGVQTSAGSLNVVLWDGSGATKNLLPFSSDSSPLAVAPSVPNGIVVAQSDSQLSLNTFDSGGNNLRSSTVSSTPQGGGTPTVLAVAQDQTGPVLTVLSNGQGIWADVTTGSAPTIVSLGAGTTAVARALIGGGVAVRLDGHWVGISHPGSGNILLRPPAWMTDGSDFVITRAGKAYAVTSGTNVITLAVGQTTCGTVTMPGVTSASVGFDGTVIGSSGPAGCSKIFWSKLLGLIALQ